MSELTREEEYKIVSTHLTGMTNLRRFTNSKDFEWLEELNNKLAALIDERREEEELRKRELQEIEEKRLKALDYLKDLGLDPNTITISVFEQGNTGKRKTKKNKKSDLPPKYAFINPETQKEETWVGVGRIKKGLQQLLDEGHSIDEFLINKNANEQN
ncbi:H-NS family nucleoid-associated regulatory protein [Xenorhabdus budapestensis]|uniref:Encodes global DNA-binding transcriptional dual regulator H-NS n=1 Tax=Xenorhabdus budapestensis TaxID=290110 RepID=A0A2D0IT29_XENBU|nr:H-NS family nucleoid-associated regulatory protein [Xenorhabdus budapestensis]PHM25057.1 encodes global DNA-binding transcriptional dual regulator H-NS [Xenorhabdus budapestensis]